MQKLLISTMLLACFSYVHAAQLPKGKDEMDETKSQLDQNDTAVTKGYKFLEYQPEIKEDFDIIQFRVLLHIDHLIVRDLYLTYYTDPKTINSSSTINDLKEFALNKLLEDKRITQGIYNKFKVGENLYNYIEVQEIIKKKGGGMSFKYIDRNTKRLSSYDNPFPVSNAIFCVNFFFKEMYNNNDKESNEENLNKELSVLYMTVGTALCLKSGLSSLAE